MKVGRVGSLTIECVERWGQGRAVENVQDVLEKVRVDSVPTGARSRRGSLEHIKLSTNPRSKGRIEVGYSKSNKAKEMSLRTRRKPSLTMVFEASWRGAVGIKVVAGSWAGR